MTFDKNNLHLNARHLALKGLAILPCESRGKRPLTAHGVTDATSDISQIDKWWRARPDANIGIACGARSGLFVLDIDGESGEESMRKLEAKNESLPATIEAITGRGRHCYFRLDQVMGNSAGRLGDGIDTRGDGGFVVAPPSVHSSGRRYEWSVDSTNKLSAAPEWLFRALMESSKASVAVSIPIEGSVGKGRRNDTLARLTGKLLSLRPHLDPALVKMLALSFNNSYCSPPLADAEAVAVFESIARLEAKKRGLSNGR